MATDVLLPSSSHARPIPISLDTSLGSCGATNCRLRKISPRLWLIFHDSSCCSDFQIFRRNLIVCAQNNGFSGCFDTTLCFPTSLVVNSVSEFRTRSAQNPSKKHLACVKSPDFLRACDLEGTPGALPQKSLAQPSGKDDRRERIPLGLGSPV